MVRLGDVAEISSGGTPSRSVLEYWQNGTIPWVKIGDIKEKYISRTGEMITELGLKNSSAKIIPKGALLYTIFATLGEVGILNIDATTNQAIAGIQFSDIVNPNYAYYFLKSLKKSVEAIGRGVAQNNINQYILKNILIPLPPLDEQKRIADVLDKASELIKKRKEQIRLMDELAKSLFIEMFGDPVENPMGWEVTSLSSCVSSIENGHSPICNNIPRVDKMFGVLKLSAVTYGTYNENENKALLDGTPFNSKIEVHNADLLVTRKNTYELVGMSAYVWKTDSGLMMSDLIFRLNTSGNVNKKYLWKLINHKSFHENIKKLAGGSAGSMPNISKKRLMGLLIPLPPLLLQNEFADRIAAIEQQKALLQDGLAKMETAYKALMQEYFG